ncbi:hypothetical protein RI129_003314 [Pyrocoelia pectoralis]|uniref:PH domain-containing protein n=1 Tax=Pyrocoelia pectoralis TaxID=417401 RepID=A0AAN7ZN01_9COLE
MISNGQIIGDGSWNLRVYVTDLQTERILRVKGDLHVGGVMLRLVEELEISMDWSDHALWWPNRNVWLTRTRSTLDQCGVQADALLHFTPMHKALRVQLPDLRYLDMRVDFSIKTFAAVVGVCKDLGIRHPEELNSEKKRKENVSQKNGALASIPPPDTNTFIPNQSPVGSTGSLDKTPLMCAPVTPQKPPSSTPLNSPGNVSIWNKSEYDANGSYSPNSTPGSEQMMVVLTVLLHKVHLSPSPEAKNHLIRPKTLVEKARMNVAWLDSSLSIMEQGVRERDTLCLRFKFYSFYDLNPKIDALQVVLQTGQPQPNFDNGNLVFPNEDDIDAALTDLQSTLEGSTINAQTNDYSMSDIFYYLHNQIYLIHFRPKRFTLKALKKYWFTCRDLHYTFTKVEKKRFIMEIQHSLNLKGCEVTPDVNISQNKYGIKLEVPSPEGMSEMYIRCDNEKQYAKWMAACRLAAKGRTLADSSYNTEVQTILDFIQMQRPSETGPAINPKSLDIQPEDYIAPRFTRKIKGRLVQRILEAHTNVKELPLIDAKLNYIKAWQSLPDYGISLFVVRFMGHKKDDLIGVAHNRLMKMDINNGDHLKTWRFNTMKAWNVNWEVKHMMVQFEEGNYFQLFIS